ncbi:cysteine peptidase family C39 domain-containing protein [uncultured Kordia sp.]|uniref:cysteine peptidase family C39 domain-containing protein n=1 Tax=uncultured Kordia sp. TaxID=507699 RepID=UPI00262F3696|nr:cysteine peptidase family C39 domain-containing protein [uncultured Kordia sp.]
MKVIRLFWLFLLIVSCKLGHEQEKPFPIILQKDQVECGPTCLQMVSRYYGVDYDIELLNKLSNLRAEGTSMGDIASAADIIGLKNLAIKIDYETLLNEVPYPAMLHWNGNHFVLVYKMDRDSIWIADPAKGAITYAKEEFLPNWIVQDSTNMVEEGYALVFEATGKFYKATTKIKARLQSDVKAKKQDSILLSNSLIDER